MLIRCLLLFFFTLNSYATGIHVALNHNPVSINDSFEISFTASQSVDDEPDFSPLESEFSILNQTQSSNTSWVNGKTSVTKQWQVTVMAKKTGNLIIPSIRFGNDVSETATVLVTKENAVAANSNEDIFLKVDASTQTPYVQSQVIYKVRLYTHISLAQAQLTEPELADALIEKIGEDSNYSTQINGVDYSVTERNYALFPQKSGVLTIKPLTLTATVLVNDKSSFNGFFMNARSTQTKRVESKEVKLTVKAIPANFKGHWLSAEQLDLKEQWSGDTNQLKIGEPLTRTLTLLAKGATVGALPELQRSLLDEGLKAYPDQAVLKENKPADGMIAFREEKIAFIPSKAGSYILPAIELAWFNTKTQQVEIAKLPAVTLSTQASAASSTPPRPAPMPVTPTPPMNANSPAPAALALSQSDTLWRVLTLLFALAWFITLAFLFYQRRHKKAAPVSEAMPEALSIKEALQRFKMACDENDAQAAKQALLTWGQHQFVIYSLPDLASHCQARLRDEILELNTALYSQQVSAWQGKKLLQAFNEQRARTQLTKPAKPSGLEPLYKI